MRNIYLISCLKPDGYDYITYHAGEFEAFCKDVVIMTSIYGADKVDAYTKLVQFPKKEDVKK